MTYQEFNKIILDYYARRSKSTFCTLSLDRSEINEIIPSDQIKNFQELKSPWNYLLNHCDSIPQYFGLVAIQCYAASVMHDDGHNASDAYQIRFREIIGLEDNNELQNLFRGLDTSNPVQEQIWHEAKTYLKNAFNLKLDIPSVKRNAGRYVQYPISQTLLTTEDLKYFTPFFSQEFQIKERISLEYFESRFNACLFNIYITNRANVLLNDKNKKASCIRQLFDYYNSWNGQVYYIQERKRNYVRKAITSCLEIEQQKLLLLFENNLPKFYLNGRSALEMPTENILSIKDYKYIYRDIILFTEMEYYQNEYEDSRFIYQEAACYILLDSNLRLSECNYLEQCNDERIEIDEGIILYKFRFTHGALNSPFVKYLQTPHPVKLDGGLKINRRNEYLIGFGPSIICNLEYAVIYEGSKYEYSPENAGEGEYKVRLDNYTDIEFFLVNRKEKGYSISSRNMGWNFNLHTVGSVYNMEGCFLEVVERDNKSLIREWIDVNLKRNKSKKNNRENLVNKRIKKSVR